MIKIENNQVFSSTGKYVHRIGIDAYFKRGTTLLTDTPASFEEVDAIPPYTAEEYNRKVAELIHQRYDADKETALINNMLVTDPTAKHRAEYAEYQAYRAECKERAKNPELYKTEAEDD